MNNNAITSNRYVYDEVWYPLKLKSIKIKMHGSNNYIKSASLVIDICKNFFTVSLFDNYFCKMVIKSFEI